MASGSWVFMFGPAWSRKEMSLNFGISPGSPGAASVSEFFRQVAYAWLLLIAATVVAVAAYSGLLNPRPAEPGPWFSRSGALITVLAIFAEQVISKMLARMHNGIQPKVRWLVYPRYFAFLLIIFGTVVWGYGDLLF
ncbi:hypothetical protein [Pseudomonas chlororaphis]|uniref:hypothetical protein n=1 Tax=Pseudomonas chlororaphis TaxID=587753 RepID=UPI0012D30F52|nr:hypothetical protein [Pseudomonas chlororaphis]